MFMGNSQSASAASSVIRIEFSPPVSSPIDIDRNYADSKEISPSITIQMKASLFKSYLSLPIGYRLKFLRTKSGHESKDYLLSLDLDLVTFEALRGETLIAELEASDPRGSTKSSDDFDDCSGAFWRSYDILKVLGEGASCSVLLARHKISYKLYALKMIGKQRILASQKRIERVKQEKLVLQGCGDHPFIVSCYGATETEDHLVLVLELCAGGELFFHLLRLGKFTEEATKFYACEILLGLEYMHSKNYVFRDCKAENILLDEKGHIRLADFGLSKQLPPPTLDDGEDHLSSFVGTLGYLSPEMIRRGNHGKPLDFYCFGCLIYVMLTGTLPYYAGNWDDMFSKRVNMEKLSFPSVTSTACKDLVQKLLHANPSQRPKIEEIKKHAWFAEINWRNVYLKKLDPPIKPLMNNVNFSPEFTQKSCDGFVTREISSTGFFEGWKFQMPDKV
jgi:serine/threonine protein kinase